MDHIHIHDPVCENCGSHLKLEKCSDELKELTVEQFRQKSYEIHMHPKPYLIEKIMELREEKVFVNEIWNIRGNSIDQALPIRPKGVLWHWKDTEWQKMEDGSWIRGRYIGGDDIYDWFDPTRQSWSAAP